MALVEPCVSQSTLIELCVGSGRCCLDRRFLTAGTWTMLGVARSADVRLAYVWGSRVSSELENASVKLVTAIIQPTKLTVVKSALANVGVERLTVCDAQGFARQRGHVETYRGHEYRSNLIRKVVLEILVNDDFVERTVKTIVAAARTGEIGDGKVFVQPVAQVIRISDGLRGPEAV